MPFRSKAQQRFMFAKNPALAKEFAAKTSNFAGLPNKVGSGGEDSSEQETSTDRSKDSPAVKAKEYGGKKKYSKAQQDAIKRRLTGGKGSGRN